MILIFLGILVGLFLSYENKALVITEYNITSDKIPRSFEGFRIVQISDLHNEEYGKNNKNLINKIIEANPHIVVLTGDIIDSRNTDVNVALDFMEQVVEIVPVYYVKGNHEDRIPAKYNEMEEEMLKLGVTVFNMKKRNDTIEVDGEKIQIIGIDDSVSWLISYRGQENDYDGTIAKFLKDNNDKNLYTILLSHRPELFYEYVGGEVDLVFTGHTHGGQIRIPYLGGVIAPDQKGLFPKFDSGLFTESDTTMIISRGVGNSIIPLRVNNRPEVVLVILNSF